MDETHIQLTPRSRVAVFLELILAELFQRFFAMFTKACHWLLSRPRWILCIWSQLFEH